MEFVVGRMKLVFDLPPGIYSAWPDSATGKTYTCKLLRAVESVSKNVVLVLSYESVRHFNENVICDLIRKENYKLIFVDRADLYVTPLIYDALKDSGAIVYLDCKNNTQDDYVCGLDCDIDFSESEIHYYVGDF